MTIAPVTRQVVGAAVCAVFALALAAPVGAASSSPKARQALKKPRKSQQKAAKARKGSPAKSATRNGTKNASKSKPTAATASSKGDVAAVLKWLREHIAATAKTGKPSDLPTQMLAGLFQLAIPNIVHGQYALASTGQALRRGGVSQAEATAIAGDMARNFGQMTRIFTDLANTPALKGQIATFFTEVAAVLAKGQAAAEALRAYAIAPNSQPSAAAFGAALDAYRLAIKAMMQSIK